MLSRPLTEPVAAVSPEDDRALRADVRRVASLLGESLERQQGAGALHLVERVRTLTKQSKESLRGRRATRSAGCSPNSRSTPPRCSCARSPHYFHLANVAEQVHRVRSLRARHDEHGWLARSITAVAARAGRGRIERRGRRARRAAGLHRPPDRGEPALGADQAAAYRRTSSRCETVPDSAARQRQDRDLAEIIDLMWQTDELRQHRPTPVDEARNAVYYLQALAGETLPGLVADLAAELARHGAALAGGCRSTDVRQLDRRRPRRQPERHPAATREVLRLQHHVAARAVTRAIDELIAELSSSTAIVPVTPELAESLEADLAVLDIDARLISLERDRAVPAQADLHERQDHQHPAGASTRDCRTGPGSTTSARPNCSPSSTCSTDRCAPTTATWSPTACSRASSARSRCSGCTWPRWTSANTPRPTTRCWRSWSTGWSSRPAVPRLAARLTGARCSPRELDLAPPAGLAPPPLDDAGAKTFSVFTEITGRAGHATAPR